MLIRNVKICMAVLFLFTVIVSPLYAQDCSEYANSEPFNGKCRCKIGYIENNGSCVQMNLGPAKVRALEMKNTEGDCIAMARIYKQFARAVGFDSKELADYVGKILSRDGILHLVSAAPAFAVNFCDSGFKPQYQQATGSHCANQVRHFTGYFVFGLLHAKGILSDAQLLAAIAEWRDQGEQADIDLGNVAAALGRQAAGSQHMMENIDVSIRSQICR